MDRRRASWGLTALLVAGLAQAATQGPPVYTYTGTAPSGACVGTRVWIDAGGSGTYYCNAGTWTAVTAGAAYSYVYDESSLLAQRYSLKFTGTGITCSDSAPYTVCDVPSGGAPNATTGTPGLVLAHATPYGTVTALVRTAATNQWDAGASSVFKAFSVDTTGYASGNVRTLDAYARGTDSSGARMASGRYMYQGAVWDPSGPSSAAAYGWSDWIPTADNGAGQATAGTYRWYKTTGSSVGFTITDTGSFSGNAATATALSTAGSATQFWKNGNVWGTPDWTDLSGKPSTFAPVDATAAVTGGIRLTGQLGGTATSPTVTGVTGAVVGVSNINATGTPSATTFLRGDGSWQTPAGGGGAPGGSSGQVQYNNAGAFGGMARVTTDGNDLILTGSTTEPSAPAAGFTKLYGAQPHGSNGPVLPFWKGGATQVDYRLFPEMRSADPVWGCLQPGAHGSATITPAGSIIAGSATGTAATVAWASTDERTRAKWVQYPSATTASSSAGLRANVDYMWRGNASGIGGFYVWGSFNIVTTTSNQRLFVGIKDATAVITATTNPSAALDTAYFGCDAGQTTIRACSNDNSGAATCTDLGANFPCTTANAAYDWAMWAQPNGSSIGYYIRRLVTGSEAQGTISTDLPRNTVALGWDYWINNGGTAAASTIQFGGVCYIANP